MAFHEGKACDAVIRVLEARLTSLSVAAYACGYLAVRGLARALDRVTLFGRTDGHPGLVTLKAEQLHCVAIVGISRRTGDDRRRAGRLAQTARRGS